MAVRNRPVAQELIFHYDKGVHYACHEFREELQVYPLIRQSMSQRANCWDNAVAESFFKSLKAEFVYGSRFKNKRAAAVEIFD